MSESGVATRGVVRVRRSVERSAERARDLWALLLTTNRARFVLEVPWGQYDEIPKFDL